MAALQDQPGGLGTTSALSPRVKRDAGRRGSVVVYADMSEHRLHTGSLQEGPGPSNRAASHVLGQRRYAFSLTET